MSAGKPNWNKAKEKIVEAIAAGDPALESYAEANAASTVSAVSGEDFYSRNVDPETGARVVVSLSSAHLPGFCACSRSGDPRPYKNGYDLGRYRIGDPEPGKRRKKREIVDAALPVASDTSPADIYFGSVELNGTGIRYYGDVCLVLSLDAIARDTVVLDRNSFDLVTPPLSEQIDSRSSPNALRDEAARRAGKWDSDLGNMAAVKVLGAIGARSRRYTNGQISAAICDDEDYMEVLMTSSFSTRELEEARVSANDAAHDAATDSRLRTGPSPRMESIIWRSRRRRAERRLNENHVPTRIVTTGGRTRD